MTKDNAGHCCHQMEKQLADLRVAICYLPVFREYAINLFDQVGVLLAQRFDGDDIELYERAASLQQMIFCPWCGSRLPESLRDKWFERLEQMGLDVSSPNMPDKMKTDAWWQEDDL